MTDPVARLGEIRARLAYPRPDSEWFQRDRDVEWLLEHIEQLQAENTELRAGVALSPGEPTWGQLRAQRQAVLDLCDQAVTRPRGRCGLELVVPVGAVRKALGADDDR